MPTSTWQDISLEDLLSEIVATFQETSPDVTISHNVAKDTGALNGDPTMLREAVRNLVDNALRHGGEALSEITLRAVRDKDDLKITVMDNGIGIPEAAIARARERFAQIAPTSASGLGLSIVEAVVSGHGGTISVDAGHPGLRVEMRFPINPTD